MEEMNIAGIEATEAAGVVGETFTPEELEVMGQWQREEGWSLNDDGALSAPVPDVFGGSITPDSYRFEVPPGLEPLEITELANVQAAMADVGIPAEIGREMGKQWNRYMAAGAADETTLKLGAIAARQELTRMHGEQQAAEMIRVANQEIAKAAKKAPWILDGLTSTELGNTVWLVSSLYNIAEARKKF